MTHSPRRYNRRSIRLKGYDYSRPGFYFITICVQNKKWLFGEILPVETPNDAEMKLNNAGIMIARWYFELENKFSEIRCHEMVIMPDHFHCIVEIVASGGIVGSRDEHIGSSLPTTIPTTIPTVVQWFKTMTTNEYIRGVKTLGWPPFNEKLWQRNYWERIIRDDLEFFHISAYIRNNPRKWYLNRSGWGRPTCLPQPEKSACLPQPEKSACLP